MQALADELRCSVMDAAAADPEWRQYATIKLLAHAEADERKRQANQTGEMNQS
jgi:hypothetical protein